jgi:hypothetical protein
MKKIKLSNHVFFLLHISKKDRIKLNKTTIKPKMPLISADEPLPPREDMYEYFAPDNRLAKIRRQIPIR